MVTYLLNCETRCLMSMMSRAVHGSSCPNSTRLDQATKIVTRSRSNIWVRLGSSGHQLNGSDSSVRQVWASNWAEFVNSHKFFFNSIFDRPFGSKLMGLLLTKIYVFLNHVYISYAPLFTSLISNWAFKLNLYAIA